MIGGIELGGTKCVLAVANNPLDIISKKIIDTSNPENTFSEIYSFFSNYPVKKLGVGSFGPIVLNSKSENQNQDNQLLNSLYFPLGIFLNHYQ